LSPTVCAALVNAILAFKSVKPSASAHKKTLNTHMNFFLIKSWILSDNSGEAYNPRLLLLFDSGKEDLLETI
jgi:hypothetical protein